MMARRVGWPKLTQLPDGKRLRPAQWHYTATCASLRWFDPGEKTGTLLGHDGCDHGGA
jgi:hypothetical protein